MDQNLRRFLMPALDVLLLALAWLLAYSFRFEFSIPSDDSILVGANYALQFKLLSFWIVATHVAFFWLFGLYRMMLRYAGMTELRAIGLASACHLLLWIVINLILSQQEQFLQLPQRQLADGSIEVLRIPYGILAFYFLMSVVSTGALRFSRRLVGESAARAETSDAPPTLIVGAGDLADSVLRSLLRSPRPEFRPVCAVAQVPSRVGLRLHGITVVGTIDKIPAVIADSGIKQVLIAMDDQSPRELQRVVAACQDAGVSFRIVPTMKDIAGGKVEISAARTIEIEDLLGREPVKLDLAADRNYLKDQVILITGAGGSIGSELSRQAAQAGARTLLLLGRGENSIFEITAEITRRFPAVQTIPLIADIRDLTRLERIFRQHKPEIVFHAAAHKHVPLMESSPEEAIKNNIFGTANVAWLSDLHGVRRFVLVSSDKAVRPTSVMGATKRFSEMIVLALAGRSKTLFAVVRFGNVLGSRGSVIPHFKRQIEAGGPLTLTHPDVTRYFMTVPEAVSLVLQAGARDSNSALYLLDMGEPVRIADLARNMITLAGYRPEADIRIEFIGLRPGEKLREELLTDTEGAKKTDIEKLYQATDSQTRHWQRIEREMEFLHELCVNPSTEELVGALCLLVPDYHPPREEEILAASAPMLSSRLASGKPLPPDGPAPGPVEQPPGDGITEEEYLGMSDEEFPSSDSGEEAPGPMSTEPDLFESIPIESSPIAEDTSTLAEAIEEEPSHPSFLDLPLEEISGRLPSDDLLDETLRAALKEEKPTPATEVDQDVMTNPANEVKGPATLLLRFAPPGERETVRLLLKQMKERVLRPGDEVICLVNDETKHLVPEGQDSVSYAGRAQGAAVAEALDKAAPDGMFVTLPAEVLLRADALKLFSEAFKGSTILVHSNFQEDRDSELTVVEPHDHEGCPHERFEYGPVIAYSVAAIRGAGGIRKDLSFAWEYDLHLRLMEKGEFTCVREALYTHFLQVVVDSTGSRVFSPGAGPLGGFSYVFYPQDMEREVTSVFEAALRRRGAYLSHETAAVDHSGRNYEKKASIVIPILNRVKYIGNAIEKVQKGTFPDFEMIIVDNGSTDGTVDLVKSIAAKDDRIRLIHGKGGSIASALNEGIRAARGKYICQLDSDDEYTPDCLEMMIGHLESHAKCGLAISYYRLMDENGRVIEEVSPITHSGYSRNQILRRDGAGAVRIFPKAVLEEFGLYDEVHYGNFGEDYDMVLKVGEKYDVDRVHKVLYHYRRHSDNTDVTRDPKMKYHNKNHSRQEALRRRLELNRNLGSR